MIILILLILFSTPVFAGTYSIEKEDGSLVILQYTEGSLDSLSDVINDRGLSGRPVREVKSPLPEAEFIKYDPVTKTIVADQDKIDAKEADDLKLADDQDKVFQKLGITREEFETIK